MKLLSSRPAIAIAALSVLTFAATACGGDDDTSSAATTPATTPTTVATTAAGGSATTAPASGGESVMAAQSSLGTILVDGDGRTLYVFTPDAQGPSVCTGECLGAWPALLGPATAGTGADAAMLGTVARPDDGTMQATYNGWPLYYFAKDAAPGDVKGQGVNGKWYAVDPSGTAIDDDEDSTEPSTTSDRGY